MVWYGMVAQRERASSYTTAGEYRTSSADKVGHCDEHNALAIGLEAK